jgi:hypothetical protein
MNKPKWRIVPCYSGWFKVQKRLRPWWWLFYIFWVTEGDCFNSEADAEAWIEKYGDLG